MRGKRFIRFILVLTLMAGLGSGAAWLMAQPGGPANADQRTVRGKVQNFTTAPAGEVDGLILNDGTWVHWPPHLADRFTAIVAKGDQVKAIGFMETGPKGDTKLEVSSLTNERTGRTSLNPDRPAVASPKGSAATDGSRKVQGVVQSYTSAPKGEVDGLILKDGTWIHWPPHLADRFTAIAVKGDQVRATGFMETGPKGDTKLEVSRLTNLRTGKSADNPDQPLNSKVDDDSEPAINPPSQDMDARLKDLERQVQELRKEIDRLRRDE
jgi:hypothetical protein